MSFIKDIKLEQFLRDIIAKGYIVESKSSVALPIFIIKKKDSKLCFI